MSPFYGRRNVVRRPRRLKHNISVRAQCREAPCPFSVLVDFKSDEFAQILLGAKISTDRKIIVR